MVEHGLRLAEGIRVRRLVAGATATTVDHLVADGPAGPCAVRGGSFVLAADAVNSAALLLASADERHPDGLANSSGLVGRNFMMHNNAHVAAVDLDRHNDATFQTPWLSTTGTPMAVSASPSARSS